MLKRVAAAVAVALASYVAMAFAGGWLVYLVTSNRHDRSLEAGMTGAFACGPLGAVLAFVVTLYLMRSRA